MTKEKPTYGTRDRLMALIEEYLIINPHMSAEGFGWATIKDASLVARLREGKDITTRKLDDILFFIGQHQPQLLEGNHYVHKKASKGQSAEAVKDGKKEGQQKGKKAKS